MYISSYFIFPLYFHSGFNSKNMKLIVIALLLSLLVISKSNISPKEKLDFELLQRKKHHALANARVSDSTKLNDVVNTSLKKSKAKTNLNNINKKKNSNIHSMKKHPKTQKPMSKQPNEASQKLETGIIVLNESNWYQCLSGEWMIKFYSLNCTACQANNVHYTNFFQKSRKLKIKVATVNVSAEPGLGGRFLISTLPTFYHVKDGYFRHYLETRSSEKMLNYIKFQGWRQVEPIRFVFSPNSLQMSLVSWLYRSCIVLKGILLNIMDKFGLPLWMAYSFLALCTILTGIILGLVLNSMTELIVTSQIKPLIFHVPEGVVEDSKKRNPKRLRDSDTDAEDVDFVDQCQDADVDKFISNASYEQVQKTDHDSNELRKRIIAKFSHEYGDTQHADENCYHLSEDKCDA